MANQFVLTPSITAQQLIMHVTCTCLCANPLYCVQVIDEYSSCLQELASLEKHLVQARARALAEDERAFSLLSDSCPSLNSISLPKGCLCLTLNISHHVDCYGKRVAYMLCTSYNLLNLEKTVNSQLYVAS